MKTYVFGRTSTGLPIPAFKFGRDGAKILILGGVHGDEHEGVAACWGLIDRFLLSYPYALQIYCVPQFNVDGVLHRTRCNARGVDLNRNLPTQDWSPIATTPRYQPGPFANSESENQALTQFIQNTSLKMIYSLHSWYPVLNVNGNCHEVAKIISQFTGYRIDESIGYPTPGSLGTYSKEINVPTLTYEIERGLDTKSILGQHVPALLESFKYFEKSETK